MGLLPSFVEEEIEEETTDTSNEIEIPKEYGIDFNTGELTGAVVEGLEAIKVWIYLALNIERYRYGIYSWDYGAELDQYIGQNYSEEYLNVAIKEDVEECLKQNEHITDVSNMQVSMADDKLHMSFHVETDIGGIDIDV